MLRSLYAILILVAVGVYVATNEATTRCITVIALGIAVLAVSSNRILVHLAILAVSRVATLTCGGATLRVRHRSMGLVDGVHGLGQRLNYAFLACFRVFESLGLQYADHVVSMALLAQHRVATQAVVQRTAVGIVVLQEIEVPVRSSCISRMEIEVAFRFAIQSLAPRPFQNSRSCL